MTRQRIGSSTSSFRPDCALNKTEYSNLLLIINDYCAHTIHKQEITDGWIVEGLTNWLSD